MQIRRVIVQKTCWIQGQKVSPLGNLWPSRQKYANNDKESIYPKATSFYCVKFKGDLTVLVLIKDIIKNIESPKKYLRSALQSFSRVIHLSVGLSVGHQLLFPLQHSCKGNGTSSATCLKKGLVIYQFSHFK